MMHCRRRYTRPRFNRCFLRLSLASLVAALVTGLPASAGTPDRIDFNRDIRSILSNNCFTCHGPDDAERQAGLRLDLRNEAIAELDSGARAIVPGDPNQSELLARITTDDDDLRMPPADLGKKLSPREIELLTRWIAEGAEYAQHWAYVKPVRPVLPDVSDSPKWKSWPRNGIDYFILDRLLDEPLTPSPEADKYALARRVCLDLTGLPPTLEQVDGFVSDTDPLAYEKYVDRLLASEAYGEHWARKWLDLARYADSAGYADDPPRTIWAYRDYVIRAFNENKPFDEFTIEQIAGDLLPYPTRDQLIATAFHRNTMTNNEGGTNDEEFRNVAVVDRVNTTMAVWMGTTMACAQCHNHKYDPLTQEEYFQLFAIFNNSADADLRDESPLLEIWTEEQNTRKAQWQQTIAELEKKITTPTDKLLEAQAKWEARLKSEPEWVTVRPSAVTLRSKEDVTIDEAGTVRIAKAHEKDVTSVRIPLDQLSGPVTALRLDALPDDSLPGKGPGFGGGNFVITRILASVVPPDGTRLSGRYVRLELPGKDKILSLAEVQVFSGSSNIASSGKASQSSTAYDGPAELAIDGNTNGDYAAKSVTHTAISENPWWELDLRKSAPIDRLVIWNRTDNKLQGRLAGVRIVVLDEKRELVWEKVLEKGPEASSELALSNVRSVSIAEAHADHSQEGFAASNVLDGKEPNKTGWAIAPHPGKEHSLTLALGKPIEPESGSVLEVRIEQLSQHANHTLGRFRILATSDSRAVERARIPAATRAILSIPKDQRTAEQSQTLTGYYLTIAPELKPARDLLAKTKLQLEKLRPYTTVPIMKELAPEKRRVTRIQLRGNFLDQGKEVQPGMPAIFHESDVHGPPDRLALARWLVHPDNPLTARVVVNRYWEALFGVGLVRTSEEFGSQGDLPSHPELLDWLACELMDNGWDLKGLLRLLVTSAAYRQSCKVSPELYDRDPENRLLARGPRFRLTAEMIRDQALFLSAVY